jgi:hypothetical protein
MTNFSIIPLASGLILTVLPFASSSLAVASESRLAWQTNATSVALRSGEKVVWCFNHATNNATKPFFHPLALPDGEALTWQSPSDHVWHYGLWFSWKYLNGVNYWEEDKNTRQSEGATLWRVVKTETRPDFSAHFELELIYRPHNAAEVVLAERRLIDVSAPAKDGSYSLDWRQEFVAGAKSVKFDRTPLPGEPGGQIYGGYAGLSLRFAKQFTNTQIRASADPGPSKDNRYRFTATAADYSGQIGNREMGVAFLDHPANPRHPTRWYAIVNPEQPFAFLNVAWLQLEPYELHGKDRFTLRYRVIVHPDRWESTRLQAEHKKFADAAISNPVQKP